MADQFTEKELAQYRDALLAAQAELEALEKGRAERTAPVQLDQTSVGRLSRMDAMLVQSMNLESERRRDIAGKRIVAALARMDEGDYGYCVQCDEAIERRRLDLDPATPTCLSCAV